MKTLKTLAAIAFAAPLIVSGCIGGSSPDKLSSGKIVKQYNDALEKNAKNVEFVPFSVGTYECDSPGDRHTLRAFEAAGLVKYDVKRYAWWEKSKKSVKKAYKVTRGYGWYTYTDTEYKWVKTDAYDFEDHYIVDIALTDKGKKLFVDVLPGPEETVDKDMQQLQNYRMRLLNHKP